MSILWRRALVFALAIVATNEAVYAFPPPAVGGDTSVNPADFRVTTFASGLNSPKGMQQLSDGSIVVATGSSTAGTSFYGTNGQLLRFVDANHDGVADGPGQVLATIAAGYTTELQQIGNLFFVVSNPDNAAHITVLRAGATPASALSTIGTINLSFPLGADNNWWHTVHALASRPTPGDPTSNDLFFNVGSQQSYPGTPAGVTASATGLITATLQPDSIYKMTVHDTGSSVNFSNITQLGNGLRNAAAIAVQPGTGDLYFGDNGIDNRSGTAPFDQFSADELNRISAANIGTSVPFFGFSSGYVAYRTGTVVGGGVQPVVAFQPLADPNLPSLGSESDGISAMAFAPKSFPPALKNGIVAGFHGDFFDSGTTNDSNPVIFYNPGTGQYFDFISNEEPNISHPDGLLATSDSLFVSDMGSFTTTTHDGSIYQIQSLVPLLGNLNADHSVNNFDIAPFELALTNPAAFLAQNPSVTDYQQRGDVNGDGVFNNFDIGPFEIFLTTGHYPAAVVPEPSTFALLGISGLFGLVAFGRRRRG